MRARKPRSTQVPSALSLPDNTVFAIAGGAGGGALLLLVTAVILFCVLLLRKVHSKSLSKLSHTYMFMCSQQGFYVSCAPSI